MMTICEHMDDPGYCPRCVQDFSSYTVVITQCSAGTYTIDTRGASALIEDVFREVPAEPRMDVQRERWHLSGRRARGRYAGPPPGVGSGYR